MLSCVLYDRVITHLKIFVFIYGPNTYSSSAFGPRTFLVISQH
jgi:hypothetical protein